MDIKNEIIIDSSVWIAFFLENDSLHTTALKLQKEILRTKYIPDFVYFEVCTVLRKKAGLQHCTNFVEFIEKSQDIEVVSFVSDITSFSTFFLQKSYEKLSFVDSTLLYLYKKDACTILTFDKEILKFLK